MDALTQRLEREHGVTLLDRWSDVVKGYWIRASEGQAQAISLDPDIISVEENAYLELSTAQTPAPWDLDRLDQPDLPLNDTFYYCGAGSGVTAYILDTGVKASHHDFWVSAANQTTRVTSGANFVNDGYSANNPCSDSTWNAWRYWWGHGTSVASLVGGLKYGVAKAVTLVPVRVLGCQANGTAGQAMQGVNWIAQQEGARPPGTPAVVNISFFYRPSDPGATGPNSFESALENLIDQYDVVVVTSANNFNGDSACNYVPSRIPSAITVAGSTETDAVWSGSNLGTCVDIFAPATNVESAHVEGDESFRTQYKDGTSFSSALVSGIAARHLASHPDATAAEIWTLISNLAVTNRLSGNLGGAPNLLAQILGSSRCRPGRP